MPMSKVTPQSAMCAWRSRNLNSSPRTCACSASIRQAPIAPRSPAAWRGSSLNSRRFENLVCDRHAWRHAQSARVAFFEHQANLGATEPARVLELGLVDDDVLIERFAHEPDHQA